jgi:hypothetical protein
MCIGMEGDRWGDNQSPSREWRELKHRSMYQKGAILILGGPKMSLDFFLVVGGFVAVFLVFTGSMAWADYQTHQADKPHRY